MSKKLTKSDKAAIKEWIRRSGEIKGAFEEFYPGGSVVDFKFPAINGDVFEDLYNVGEADINGQDEMEPEPDSGVYLSEPADVKDQDEIEPEVGPDQVRELMKRKYNELHQNVKKGIPGYVEVCLDKGTVCSATGEYNIGNAIAVIERNNTSKHVFFKDGDRCNARIIIGGTPMDAYIAFLPKEKDKDNGEDVVMVAIHGFNLFGICDDAKSGEEDGVMVNYYYCDTEVTCYHMRDFEFEQIRDLLLADWLQNEWAKAKEDKEKQSENGEEKP